MPVTSAIAAYGTQLKIGDGQGTESFTTIAEVTTLDWSGMKVTTVSVTNHGSPSAFAEVIPTIVDPGTIKFSVNFRPDIPTHAYTTGLLRDLKNRNLRNFQFVFPNAAVTTWPFAGYVTEFAVKTPVEGKLQADFAVEITGLPAFV